MKRHTFFTTTALILAVVLTELAYGEESVQPASSPVQNTPPKRIALKVSRILDPRTGGSVSNAFVNIENDRIVSIGTSPPEGARVIDLSGLTVLPGLVDCHAHVLGNPKDDSPTADLRMSSAQAALWGVHNLQIWLNHGFTSLRDAGQSDLGYGQLALRDSVQNGLITGPRMVSAGNFISVSGGHGDGDVLAPDQALPRRQSRRHG